MQWILSIKAGIRDFTMLSHHSLGLRYPEAETTPDFCLAFQRTRLTSFWTERGSFRKSYIMLSLGPRPLIEA